MKYFIILIMATEKLLPAWFDPTSKDPRMWERLLEAEGLQDQAPTEEVDAFSTAVERAIAANLAAEGENNHFRGCPLDLPQLIYLVKEGVEELKNANPENGVCAGLRTSCTNGALTFTLWVPRGTRLHWNLMHLNIKDLDRFRNSLESRLRMQITYLD